MDKKKILIIAGSVVAVIAVIVIVLLVFNHKVTYTVSFETNGGSKVESQLVKEGQKVQKPVDPTKEGYAFVEWTNNGKMYDFSREVKSNLTLVAKWVKVKDDVQSFIVRFDTDGGTTISNQVIEKGNKVEKPADPVKEGHTFKGWTLNNEDYDFEKVVEKNIVLKAKWEKVEETKKEDTNKNEQNNNTNNNTNTNTNANNNTSNNNQQTQPPKTEVKLATPSITKNGIGMSPEAIGMGLKLNSVEGITGVEVYSATSENGTYTLYQSVKKEQLTDQTVNVNALKGQHLYFKVRTYLTNADGTFYSAYSNVMDLNNSLRTPSITKDGIGMSPEAISIGLKLDSLEGITGVEVYSSTSQNGAYTLYKSVKTESLNNQPVAVEALNGQHLYFKVRTYVTNAAGTFYSGYSNVLDLNNSLRAPTITKEFAGASPEQIGYAIKLNSTDGLTGMEVYTSTSENGPYTLHQSVKSEDFNSCFVHVLNGQRLYVKVRTYVTNAAGTFYSDYSNVVELVNNASN